MFYSYAFNTKSKKHRNLFKKYKTGGRKRVERAWNSLRARRLGFWSQFCQQLTSKPQHLSHERGTLEYL